jgi:hypothetical protein
MAGIEPATATLAGRARYLSCHPRRQASVKFAFGLPFSWCSRYGRVNYPACTRGFSGRSIRPEVNETAPEGRSPGAAAGNCLLALTRQPLRRPGQPKAAAPDSCIRAAPAPGERSCIHGKPTPETGQLYFPCHSAVRCQAPGEAPGYRRVRALGVGWLSMREGCRCGEARCRGDPGWAPASGTRAP